TAPHFPLHAFPEDIQKYKGRFDEGWDRLREKQHQRMVKMGVIDPAWGLAERDSGTGPFDSEEYKEYRLRGMEVYAAMVDRMDRNIGRIVDALERSGKLDNTVIFFFSDNGGQAGELAKNTGDKRYTPLAARDGRPMRAGNDPGIMPGPEDTYQSIGTGWATLSNTPFRKFKAWTYEGGIASPLIVHWPAGISEKGKFRGQVGHIMDIMPTCCELAGVRYPSERQGNRILPQEGVSLVRALRNEPVDRDALFWEHAGHRAVRRGRWKLVAALDSDWELYDMEADRTEQNNLAASHPDIVTELTSRYAAWVARCGVRPWKEISPATSAESKRQDNITREYRKKRR
ncbi:MAG: sulfatase-like hydrolase/transferase, partial [Candidatus Latescibacterota bacterium]